MLEKAVYTNKQMSEMMSITRSWVLNNPNGPLPYLPIEWVDYVTQEENESANISTMPQYKKTHWLISLLSYIRFF